VMSIADNLQSNRTQSFGYDVLNRITSAQTQGTTGADCWAQSFGYDAWGNLLSETPTRSGCPMTQLSVSVNTQNRITNSGFSYDASGNLLGDGSSTYTYDAESRISTLNGTGAAYFYDSDGQRVRKQLGNDTTEYAYFNGQPIAERKANGDWSDYIYAGSRRIARGDDYEDRLYTYGTVCGNCGWQAATYTFPNYAGLGGYVIQSGDLLVWRQWQTTGAHGGIAMWFTDGSVAQWVTYDQDGQAIDSDGYQQQWHYRRVDMSQHVGKTIGSWTLVTESTTQAGNWGIYYQDLALVSRDGTVHAIYSRQPTVSLTPWGSSGMTGVGYQANHCCDGSAPPDTTTNYYHGDHLGSARLMTGYNGYPVVSATFLPFGQEWNPQITVNHYKFTSKERDSESGLDNFGARYNSSQYGRFMSVDPDNTSGRDHLGDPQSWNGYAYARNNPLLYVDPDGENYTVCQYDSDGNKTNCADLTQEQFDQYRQDNSNVSMRAGGDLYAGGTKIGNAAYYDEHAFDSLIQAGHSADVGVKAAMVLTAPNYLLMFGATVALSGAGTPSLGLPITNQAAGQIIGWGSGQGAAGVQATRQVTQTLTKEAVKEMIEKGLTRSTVEGLENQYARAAVDAAKSAANPEQLPARLELMRKILELWPK
jgi:RHS repeat-associated protein